MFNRIVRAAEQMASNVTMSRRSFFDRLGRRAVAASGIVGGVLAWPVVSQAGGKCCHYSCYPASSFTKKGPCHHIAGCVGTEFAC